MLMTLTKTKLKWAVMATFLAGASGAYAFGLGGLSKDSKGEQAAGSSSVESLDAVLASQENLMRKYMAANYSIAKANEGILSALDDKKGAAAAADEAEIWKSGASDKNTMKKATKMASKTGEKISTLNFENAEMSKDSKKKFSQSMVSLLAGVAATASMADEFAPFIQSAQAQISSASPMKAMKIKKKLDVGLYVAMNTPGQIASLTQTTGKLVSYAKAQNIDIPKEASNVLPD